MSEEKLIEELDDQKLFYTMGEVTRLLNIESSTLRFWQKEFPTLIKPHRNAKGNRLFTKEDIKKLRMLYHLIKEKGMTLEGAKNHLKAPATGGIDERAAVIDRLKRVKNMLREIRDNLGESDGE